MKTLGKILAFAALVASLPVLAAFGPGELSPFIVVIDAPGRVTGKRLSRADEPVNDSRRVGLPNGAPRRRIGPDRSCRDADDDWQMTVLREGLLPQWQMG